MKTSSERSRGHGFANRAPGPAWLVVLTAIVAFAVTLSAHAQSPVDPPSRVARLSEAEGQVLLYSADNNEWISIARNRPLTTGDRIATDKGAHAEVMLGTTTLRLDAATELEIVRLDDSRFQVRLEAGSIAARLRNPQSLAEFSLETDEGGFRVQAVGRYRFDRFDRTSDVTVYSGQAIYEAGNTALPVAAGQHAQFWVDAAGAPQYAMQETARDAFAGWNDERDRAEDSVATTRYVSPEMTGADDLNRYGSWEQTPEYGALWVPRGVPVGWAPYSAGHWAWIRPWGWTWVDDAPWGFAPFHYGRWVMRRNVWCWAPGTYVARPVYAPALVAWIGGPSVSVSVAIGGGGPAVGWFPLAPREVYVPAYRTSTRYVREVNITHVTNVTNITTIVNNRNGEADRRDFANRKFPQAVTFVPADVMLHRQAVGPVAARMRNDPQVRSLVADASPRVVIAPAVTAPPSAPRSQQGRPPPRPPFEGRSAATGGRPDGVRPPGGTETSRPDAARAGIPAARPDGVRPPPVVGTTPAPARDIGAKPPVGVTQAAPPVGARGVVEPSNGPPARAGTSRDEVSRQSSRTQVAPPGQAQRNAQPGEAGGRPVPHGREVAVDGGGGPKQATIPGPRNYVPREVAPAGREAGQHRPPPAAAPVAPQAAPPAPPAAAQHGGEQRMTRPEAPRNREERKDEKRDDKGEKQR
ncbi:MAG TPA: DUF6600 domain-containing protein [Caldimonas sp.]|jgi:hypothetical protein